MSLPFWQRKSLAEMTAEEWESLCDGCGKCCLHKLEDEHSGKLHYTNVACHLLNLDTCRCRHYEHRSQWVPDCVQVTATNIDDLRWMPLTCAYRLLAEGKALPDWHPLVSGNAASVHKAGASIRSWAQSETAIRDVEEHIISWRP